MGAIKRDDLGTVGPGLGTRTGAHECHFEPALFNGDVGHRSRVLFPQRLEQAGELVDGGFFGVFVLPRFCNSLPYGRVFHIDAKLCFETSLKVLGSELFNFTELLLRPFNDPRPLDFWL